MNDVLYEDMDSIILKVFNASVFVRMDAAKNFHTPIEYLFILCRDKEMTIRKYVAENANVSAQILVLLVNDEMREVRQAVATNEKINVEIVRIIANNPAYQLINDMHLCKK